MVGTLAGVISAAGLYINEAAVILVVAYLTKRIWMEKLPVSKPYTQVMHVAKNNELRNGTGPSET
jgi:hypothetical protein